TDPPLSFLCHRSAAPPHLPPFPTRRSSDLPRLVARVTSSSRAATLSASGLAPRTSNESIPPNALICRAAIACPGWDSLVRGPRRSEEHTSELQSLTNLVCRLLLEKKKHKHT